MGEGAATPVSAMRDQQPTHGPELAATLELDPGSLEIIRKVVRRNLAGRHGVTPQDVEDVCSDCIVALLEQIGSGLRIEHLEAYIATVARRACSAWARRRYPAFHRLRVRLRAMLDADPRFALWEPSSGVWLCSAVSHRSEAPTDGELAPERFADLDLRLPAPDFVFAALERLRQPVAFNALARLCAVLWGVEDASEVEATEALPAAAGSDMESTLDRRASLTKLWSEIRELPLRQRTALLLNLRGDDGECGTSFFAMTGIATLREMSSALEMTVETFTELWRRLPLTDNEIAERMGLTRQQVINLRSSARERLKRRMLRKE